MVNRGLQQAQRPQTSLVWSILAILGSTSCQKHDCFAHKEDTCLFDEVECCEWTGFATKGSLVAWEFSSDVA